MTLLPLLQKLLLGSILAATLAIPILAARAEHPRRGLRRALLAFVAFDALYLVFLRLLYPRLF